MRGRIVRPTLVVLLALLGAASPETRRHHPARPGPDPVRHELLQAQQRRLTEQGQAARALAAETQARLEAARQHAAADAARAARLSQATVQAASRVQATERDAATAGDRVAALAARRVAAQRALQADAAALAPMLPAIERLSLYPAETLLAAPASLDDSLAGLMVLRGLGAGLERRARALKAEQAELALLGATLGDEQARLSELERRQAGQQAAVAARAQAAQAAQLASRAGADQAARAAADAAARAATLGDAVARLEAAQHAAEARFRQEAAAAETARQPEAARQARAQAATLATPAGPGLQGLAAPAGAPVAGRLVQGFGQPTDAGAAAGVTYAPPSLATVTAPCTGRIDFAGPFRSYGRMLILDCGRDYRFVLAGLDRLDVAIGQSLARGAAIGRMPAWSGQAAGGGRPSLYVQLRHGDAAIDPVRFLQPSR